LRAKRISNAVVRFLSQDAISNAADELGLLNLGKGGSSLDVSHMFLVQMPAVLPISQASIATVVKPTASVSSADASVSIGVAGPSSGAVQTVFGRAGTTSSPAASPTVDPMSLRGCALRELPSGSVGRLLVYRSGKVKLQIGEVLMEVMPGLACKHRIDVRSIEERFWRK